VRTDSSTGQAPSGAALVVGSSLDEWGLLTVPRSGGPANVRSIRDPGQVVWRGKTRIPATNAAWRLEDGLVFLRTRSGSLVRFDPAADEVSRIGALGSDVAWNALGDAGALLDLKRRQVLHVAREGSWVYRIPRSVSWAAPVDGGALTILTQGDEGSELWLLRRGEEHPARILRADVARPGVVTAWGRRLVLARADSAGLQVLGVEPLAPAGRIAIDAPITAVATSPSTHEIYVGLDAPPRLVAVNRFSRSRRTLARFSTAVSEIRSSLFGEFLLAKSADSVYRVALEGGSRALPVTWRSDLPLGLPGGRVLGIRGDRVVVVGGKGEADRTLAGASPQAWWLPVPWTVRSNEVEAERLVAAPLQAGVEEEAGEEPEPVGSSDSLSAGPSAGTGPPPGFYAIVASARSERGVDQLIAPLATSGFPTAVQTHTDDAGQLWYRGLVGPFASREAVEAVRRQLEREQGLHPWVIEISGPPGGPASR